VLRLIVSFAIHLVANAVGLLVANLVLDDLTIDAGPFLWAVLIFTVVETFAGPLIMKIALQNAKGLMGGIALVVTFVGLFVTEIIADGFDINGVSTWIAATVIVWLAAMLAGLIIPVILVKSGVESARAKNNNN
jgi:putative membrane protein